MATVYVNGESVDVGEDRLNLVQAAARAGVEIPHYCWHPELSVVASCRMCLVETGERKPDGSVQMMPKVVPACQTPAKDGTVIVTNSDKVRNAQKGTLEYLLLNHPLDCPICDQAGECFLQDYSFKYGRAESRLQEPKLQKADKHHIGEQIVLFTDRCVMCSRCVRFTREVSGTAELQIIERGSHAEIDIFPGKPCDNKLAGNVVDICPVGALCSRDFLYKQRVWWLEESPSVCPDCSTGCSIRVDSSEGKVYRLKPRPNPKAQGSFMCDEGRYGFKYLTSPDRLVAPKIDGANATWSDALAAVRAGFTQAAQQDGSRIALVLSPWATIEEAFLAAQWIRNIAPTATLALGPVRVEGEDDSYPKGPKGEAPEKPRFTIRAEKAPNRRGIEILLNHLADGASDGVLGWEAVEAGVAAGRWDAVFVLGGDPRFRPLRTDDSPWGRLPFLVVQDILENDLARQANILLPGAAFAEKEGTYINHAGLAQTTRRAIRAPGEARPDGRILWELSGRTGLYQSATIRRELAEIPAFTALDPASPASRDPLGIWLDQAAPAMAET